MTIKLNKIFVVIDPTTEEQFALRRAANIAESTGDPIHVYLCIELEKPLEGDELAKLTEVDRKRLEPWLEGLVQPIRDRGIDVDLQLDWQQDWRESLAPAAAEIGAGLIVKSSIQHSKARRHLLKTSDWTLLRTATCPVQLVKSDRQISGGKVLAAVDINASDNEHQELNDLIVDYSHAIAAAEQAELHAVNAYRGSLAFTHPPDVARRVRIEPARVHVADASPQKAIPEVAAELGAVMVVVGSVARAGVRGAVLGNTVEKILDRLECDIFAINNTPASAGVQQAACA